MTDNLNLITNEEVDAAAVASATTILNGTPQENKSIFDKLCKEVVIPKVNLLITAHMNIDAKVEDNTAGVTENKENIQELSQSIGNPSDLLHKNQGTENVGKILAVGEDGCVTLSDPIDCGNIDTSVLLRKNQGTSNAGKILVVGADGNLTLTDMPSGEASDIVGVVGDNNAITLTGDLADGTYIFRYENTDGSYTDIGTLVIGGVVQYSITTSLTNCTASSGNPTIINAGETISLTFVANDGFALTDTVAVTGATYTWDSTSGVLALSNPTEDITISITATKSGYTNIIDTIGYSDGHRLSVSSGSLSAKDGYTTTGMIDTSACESPVTIRTKGVNFNYATGLCNIALYNSDGDFVSALTLYGGRTENWNLMTWSFDDDGNLTLIQQEGAASYIKISGYGSGENLIVTLNEEITE